MVTIRKLFCVFWGMINHLILKIFHWRNYHSGMITYFSPFAEVALRRNGLLSMGNRCQLRKGVKLSIHKNGKLNIGHRFYCGNDSMVVCHHDISIGDDVQFGPEVLVYDHDHDFAHPDGLKAEKYKYSPVKIGNSVWIGARSIILRGTEIGDNSVVAAGTVLKGIYPANSIIYQRRDTEIKQYIKRNRE